MLSMMDDDVLYKAIFKRRSVRKFDMSKLDEGTMASIVSRISKLERMMPEIRTEVRLLQDEPVKGMFKVDAPHYLAFYTERKGGHLPNSGFMLQQMDLFFNANGIGSCWQGELRPAERIATELEPVVMMAFGRPAEMLDRSVDEFKRVPMKDITDIEGMDDLLETARLAPSAGNRQMWYFTRNDGAIDVHYKRSLMFDHYGQMDSGIALFHLLLSARHQGKKAVVAVHKGVKAPKGHAYSASLDL
ncbi:MAG: hypothetical protein LUQ09_04055 [Methanomassiliicoccales archaeon]|nr:hypothetical protein [Methanomassiliicoccales archaeon]